MSCATSVAGIHRASPGWLAVTVQMPSPAIVTLLPETVQMPGVVLAYSTGRPELAVAGGSMAKTVPASKDRLACAGKRMAWALRMRTSALASAGSQWALPAWRATRVQMPPSIIVTVVPETVQTAGVALP